jgi:urease accessory protein
MGRQTLRLARTLVDVPFLLRFAGAAEAGTTPTHHPVVFGVIGGVLGWTGRDTATAYLQASATTVVQAALRLVSIGQTEGQKALWAMGDAIARQAAAAADMTFDGLWSFTPGQEIAAMQHARLDARLFRS